MRTVILGPRPEELNAMIARRQALGLDTHDEVWKGEYHMAPAARPHHGYLHHEVMRALDPLADRVGLVSTAEFNLGDPDDFRVPDFGYHRALSSSTFGVPTAAIVVEILSPHDETWEKLDFYAAHGVDEILTVSGADRTVTWLILAGGRYERASHSQLLGAETADLADRIDWPPAGDDPPGEPVTPRP